MGIKDEGKNSVSAKVLKKAKRLKVEEMNGFKWLVLGGSEPHVVQPSAGGEFECDCLAFRFRGICSHIMAVKLFLENNKV